jgi:hypothetical protein
LLFLEFTAFTIRKTTNAVIRKVTISFDVTD